MDEFRHPSRILEQVASVSVLTDINSVYVASLWGEGQTTDNKINKTASAKKASPSRRKVCQKVL
jgi:hypothetical protein